MEKNMETVVFLGEYKGANTGIYSFILYEQPTRLFGSCDCPYSTVEGSRSKQFPFYVPAFDSPSLG